MVKALNLGTMRENALTDPSAAAGSDLEAARWVVEGREDTDKEGVQLGWDFDEKLRVEWKENAFLR